MQTVTLGISDGALAPSAAWRCQVLVRPVSWRGPA